MRGCFLGEVDLFQIEKSAFVKFFDRLACESIELPLVVSGPAGFGDFEVSEIFNLVNLIKLQYIGQ